MQKFWLQTRQHLKHLMNTKLLLLSPHGPCTLTPPPRASATHFTLLNFRRLSSSLNMNPAATATAAAATTDGGNVKTSTDDNGLGAIFKEKKSIRSKVRKCLKDMDPSHRAFEDDAIQRLVLDAPWFKSSRRLCAYISCRALREVDTSKVLADILQSSDKDKHNIEGKTLYVPRVEDKNSHMRMLNISSLDDLIANSMDILEPAPVDSEGNQREDVMHASEAVDLLLLPGLAFDKSGRRLGRGGGYYDTFLMNYQQLVSKQNWKKPLLVALSYSVQILDDGVIPVTLNDVNVDALVSPAGIIPISSAALERMESDV